MADRPLAFAEIYFPRRQKIFSAFAKRAAFSVFFAI
jgi:hypothetical protein